MRILKLIRYKVLTLIIERQILLTNFQGNV